MLGVRVGSQRTGQGGAAVDHVAHLRIGPYGVAVGARGRLPLLLHLHVRVLRRARLLGAVDVHDAHRPEHAVDLRGLGLEGRRHGGVLAETRSHKDSRCHGKARVNLPHHFQAGFVPGGNIHAAHDVGGRDHIRVQLLPAHGQVGCAGARAAVQKNDVQRPVVVERGGVVHVPLQLVGPVFHYQLVQQHAAHIQRGHAVLHGYARLVDSRVVLGRVKDVHQDKRAGVHDGKVGADTLAERVLGKIRHIAHRRHRLRIAVHQLRLVDRLRRFLQHIHRGRPENHLEASGPFHRRDQACLLLADVYAMFISRSHKSVPPIRVPHALCGTE